MTELRVMNQTPGQRHPRASRLGWVRIGDLHVSDRVQRSFRKPHAESLAAKFDLEALGFIVVSIRDGKHWIVDGQHRVAALKLLGFCDDDTVQCEIYEGMTERDDADLYLNRQERKAPTPYDKFRIAVIAERQREVEIERVVRAQGLRITKADKEGIRAVTTLCNIYDRSGPIVLGKTLRIIRDAFGSVGFDKDLMAGMALACERYNGLIDETNAAEKLGGVHGGVNGVLGAARKARLATGHQMAHCVAASVVDILNRGRSKKLAPWWKA